MRFSVLVTGAALFALAACDSSEVEKDTAAAKEEVETAVEDAKSEVQGAVDAAKAEVEEAIDAAKTEVDGAVDDAKAEVSGAVSDAQAEVGSAVEAATEEVQKEMGAAMDAVKGAVQQTAQTGTATMSNQCTAGSKGKVELKIKGQPGDTYTITMGCPGTADVAQCTATIKPGDTLAECTDEGDIDVSGTLTCNAEAGTNNSTGAFASLYVCM